MGNDGRSIAEFRRSAFRHSDRSNPPALRSTSAFRIPNSNYFRIPHSELVPVWLFALLGRAAQLEVRAVGTPRLGVEAVRARDGQHVAVAAALDALLRRPPPAARTEFDDGGRHRRRGARRGRGARRVGGAARLGSLGRRWPSRVIRGLVHIDLEVTVAGRQRISPMRGMPAPPPGTRG